MTLRADTPLDAMMRESQGQGELQVAVLGSNAMMDDGARPRYRPSGLEGTHGAYV